MARHHLINGVKVQFTSDEETARDAEEKAWNDDALNRALLKLREDRNNLLAKTDWTSSSDLTMSDEMKTYRQQLRDITKTHQDMEADGFAWPTKP